MFQKDLVYEIIKVNSLVRHGRRLGNRMFLGFKDEVAVTGNINFFYEASAHVLRVLSDFEKINQDLKITNWKPETYLNLKEFVVYCFGVWIDFEPREEKIFRSDLAHTLTLDRPADYPDSELDHALGQD